MTGTVRAIDAKGAVVTLDGDMEGYLRASEVSRDRVEDIRTRLKEGDKVTAMIINIDRKNRTHQSLDQGERHRRGSRGDPEARRGQEQRGHHEPRCTAQGEARHGQPTISTNED